MAVEAFISYKLHDASRVGCTPVSRRLVFSILKDFLLLFIFNINGHGSYRTQDNLNTSPVR
jgi:hypothetical protein